MIATHAFNMNGQFWAELKEPSADAIPAELSRLLRRLDGRKIYSLILWRLPTGKSLDETEPERDATEYVQAAGSAERMTVELRTIVNGEAQQLVVGRGGHELSARPDAEIHWSTFTLTVHSNEVFSADEAATLFHSYYAIGDVAEAYRLRRITL